MARKGKPQHRQPGTGVGTLPSSDAGMAVAQWRAEYDVKYHVHTACGRLGRGTFGEVSVGWNKELGAVCAIKRVWMQNHDKVDDDLSREAHLGRRCMTDLKHRNIVEVFDVFTRELPLQGVGTGEDIGFICMELCLHSLHREIKRTIGQVPFPLVRRWLADLFRGLGHLHAHDVVHRDLKPGNLMLAIDPQTAAVVLKLVDFGSAREVRREAELTPNRCTEWYAAPESLDATYSMPSDLWSSGAICGELLLGVPLFVPKEDANGIIAIQCRRLGLPTEEEAAALGSTARAALTKESQLPRGNGNLLDGSMKTARPLSAVPSDGHRLLASLLRWSPRDRPTAEQALRHEFLTENTEGAPFVALPKPNETADRADPIQKDCETPVRSKSAEDAETANGDIAKESSCKRKPARIRLRTKSPGNSAPSGPVDHKPAATRFCACTGHCLQPGHRYYQGCAAPVPDKSESTFCEACKCCVRGCIRGKNGGATCYGHARKVASLCPALQIVFHLQTVLQGLVPCDLQILAQVWPDISDDLLFQTLAAVMKEPTPILRMAQLKHSLPKAYEATELFSIVLKPLVEYMHSRCVKVEHENLNGQGALILLARVLVAVGWWVGC